MTTGERLPEHFCLAPNRFVQRHFPVSAPFVAGLFLLAGCGTATTTPPPPAPPPQLAVWTNNFNGVPFTMVGTDPSHPGAGTTNVPVVIIPVSFNFGGVVLSPDHVPCADTENGLTRVKNSPLFSNNSWSDGATFLGNTQFGDAFQRANFWSIVSAHSPEYHVMLHPISALATVNVDVPANIAGPLIPNATCPSQPYGSLPISFMDTVVANVVETQHITADTLPIFLTYNTAFLLPGGGFFLGYHYHQDKQTYIAVSYMDSGVGEGLGVPAPDITVLSHEIGEWIDNPFYMNMVSPWGAPRMPCQTELEVGDPLESSVLPYVDPVSGFTYHLQELAYFSWFARDSPSLAVNSRYSTRGSFVSYASPCS